MCCPTLAPPMSHFLRAVLWSQFLDLFLARPRSCHLSSHCSESTVFTFNPDTKKSKDFGSFGTPNCMQECSKSSGSSSRACSRGVVILRDLCASSSEGGDPGGRCKWSPPVVARGFRSVHNFLLVHLRRQAKRIALLLGRCVFAMCFQNDI